MTEAGCWVRVTLVALICAPASAWAEPPEYAVQFDSSVQYQNNPGGLPESMANDIVGSTVLANTLGLGLSWPFASPDTRLDLAGSATDVRYSDNQQLDHQPQSLNATFYWRAGSLLAGNIHYDYNSQLNVPLNTVWPERDMQTSQNASAELGLRVTDKWEVPVVQVFRGTVRYDSLYNALLYNSNQNGWQVSSRYLADPGGVDGSQLEAGVRHTSVTYPWRQPEQTAIVDNAYADTEWFAGVRWDVSPKTLLEARAGLLQRNYANLNGRDTRFVTLDLHGMYNLSPTLLLDMRLWRRPFSDDTDPNVIYSIQNGGSLNLFWRATPKTLAALFYQQTLQHDYSGAANVSDTDELHLPGYGVRFQWQPRDNVRWMLDVVSQRQQGLYASDNYNQRYVRIGFEYAFGSHGQQSARKLLTPYACTREHPALLLCGDEDPRVDALQ